MIDGGVIGEFAAYLRRRGYARTTTSDRVAIVRRWVEFAGREWPCATFKDVERWLGAAGWSAESQRVNLAHVRAFYRWAMREGMADADPTSLVDRPRCRTYLPRPATDDDIAAVLARATPATVAMVAVMATAGLRCCEIAAANWADLDERRGELRVHGKGRRDRVAYLAADVLALVRRHRADLDVEVGPMWPGVLRPRLSAPRVSQIVNGALREAGSAATAHQLRHRTGTVALRMSGDLSAVRDLLGHVTVSTTEVYAAVAGGVVERVGRSIPLPAIA